MPDLGEKVPGGKLPDKKPGGEMPEFGNRSPGDRSPGI